MKSDPYTCHVLSPKTGVYALHLVQPEHVSRGLSIKGRRSGRQTSFQARWGREKHWLCDLVEKRCFHPGRGWGGSPASDPAIAKILNVSSIPEGNLVLLSSPSPSSTHRKKAGHIFSPKICRMAVAMSTGIHMLLDIRFFRSSVAMVTKYHLPD